MKMTKVHRKEIREIFFLKFPLCDKYSNWYTPDLKRFAKKLGTTVGVARKIVTGNCLVSPRRAIIIESLTGVSKSILRPDIFKENKK